MNDYVISILFRIINFLIVIIFLVFVFKRYAFKALRKQIDNEKQKKESFESEIIELQRHQHKVDDEMVKEKATCLYLKGQVNAWLGDIQKKNKIEQEEKEQREKEIERRLEDVAKSIYAIRLKKEALPEVIRNVRSYMIEDIGKTNKGNEFVTDIVNHLKSRST